MQAGHHGPDRNVEDLRRIGIAEVADVDEHQHVAEVVRHLRERRDGVVLGKPAVDPLLVRLARFLELVVEEVVALFQRLHVGRALDATAAVDVQVGEDAEQPGAQVGPRLVGAPGTKCARIGLLHQVFRLFPGGHESPGDPIDLVGECERLLLEADAVAGLLGQLPGLRFGCGLAHRGHPSNCRFLL